MSNNTKLQEIAYKLAMLSDRKKELVKELNLIEDCINSCVKEREDIKEDKTASYTKVYYKHYED